MTLDDAAKAINEIRAAGSDHDDEAAHSMEDRLHKAALRAIASGTAPQPSELAALVLTTEDIDFARWCA